MNDTPKKYKSPVPVDISKVYDSLPEPAGPAVVSNGRTDEVRLDACIYKNVHSKKSLTIHHLQRRLTELGYTEANQDKDGWYGDLTRIAIARFQNDKGLFSNGIVDAATFLAIFNDDVNVTIIL